MTDALQWKLRVNNDFFPPFCQEIRKCEYVSMLEKETGVSVETEME